MQAAHYLKSLTEVPVRDAPSAAAPHLYAISNGLAVFALSKRMVREDGQLSAWFELAQRGQAPPFAAAGDDTIEVAHPRVLAAIVALKRGVELLAGPKGSYASSRWQKRSFRLPQLHAFEAAGAEEGGVVFCTLQLAALGSLASRCTTR